MADALLSPEVGLGFFAVSGGALAWSSARVQRDRSERKVPLMGVLGAFVFGAQMVNFTIPATGSSGHLGGGMLLACLLGPHAALVTIASVLVVQAFFFADGGLLALGTNVFNLGVVPSFLGSLVLRAVAGGARSGGRFVAGTTLAVVASLETGALSVAGQTVLSGKTDLPFDRFAPLLVAIHLPIALVESAVTVAVVALLARVRPEVLSEVRGEGAPAAAGGWRPRLILLAGFLAAALATGGGLVWIASTRPDGLEWAMRRVAGDEGTTAPATGLAAELERIQEKTAVFPDYKPRRGKAAARGREEGTPAPGPRLAPAAGVLGGLATLALVCLFAGGLALAKGACRRHGGARPS